MQVRDIMTENPLTLDRDSSINLADELMKLAHIRHIPVVEKGKLVGLVTHRDLIRPLAMTEPADRRMVPVETLMQADVDSASPDDPLESTIDRLIDHKYGCFPVVDAEHHLVGIITEADFLKLARRLLRHTARD